MTTTRDTLFAEAERLEAVAAKASWKKYAEYRDSGVEWLGPMPRHWDIRRMLFLTSINPTKSEVRRLAPDTEASFVPMEAVQEFGGLALDATKPIEDVLQGYTYFRDGDIVVAKITPCFENGKGSIASDLVNGIGFGTTELHVIRPAGELDTKYLFYLTLSHAFRHLGAAEMYGAGGQKRVPDSFLRDFRTPIPPPTEQQAIAAFLDRKTQEIDELIEKKRRLIELLQEQRTALISHAVTKGLKPDAATKPSGVDWLGDVPEHWEVKQLKYAATFQRGHDLPLDARSPGDVPIVTSAGESAWHDTAIAPGPAIVTGRYGTIGVFHLIEHPFWPLNTTLYTIDLRGNRARFLWYMLHLLAPVFLSEAGKSAVPGVDRNDLHPVAIAVPPIEEQEEIEHYLDQAMLHISGVIETTDKAALMLVEYRQAMISAAVTGKIDVRDTGRTAASSGRVALEETTP